MYPLYTILLVGTIAFIILRVIVLIWTIRALLCQQQPDCKI
jgi:hypothetical protein